MGTKREHVAGNVIQCPWSAPSPTGADESEQQRLAQEIAAQIVAGHGSVVRWTSEVSDVDDWRRAARCAGRLLAPPTANLELLLAEIDADPTCIF